MSDIEPVDQPTEGAAVPAPSQDADPASATDPEETPGLPARAPVSAVGVVTGTLNFVTLSARIAVLTTAAFALKEGMWALQRHMESNATKARTLSEMCDAAEVEPQYTAQILEASAALHRVATASGDLADTADQMESNARGFNDAHEREYRGIYEATKTGPRQPKPGFNRVR